MDTLVIQHYGVKGMKWGVRKARLKKGAKAQAKVAGKFTAKFFLGEIQPTSLVYAEGRKSFKEDVKKGKAAVGKVTGSKAFKTTVYDGDNSAVTSRGRKNLARRFKKNADKRYKKALEQEASRKAAAEAKAKTARKKIEKSISEEVSYWKKAGKPMTSKEIADTRKTYETIFASDLKGWED